MLFVKFARRPRGAGHRLGRLLAYLILVVQLFHRLGARRARGGGFRRDGVLAIPSLHARVRVRRQLSRPRARAPDAVAPRRAVCHRPRADDGAHRSEQRESRARADRCGAADDARAAGVARLRLHRRLRARRPARDADERGVINRRLARRRL